EVAGPRTRLDMVLGLASLDVAHLRMRFFDAGDYAPPPPLRRNDGDAAPPVSVEQLRQQGGPSLAEYRVSLHERLHDGAATVTAGEVFEVAPVDLRRPVEVLGLTQTAAAAQALAPAGGPPPETFKRAGPDGTAPTSRPR